MHRPEGPKHETVNLRVVGLSPMLGEQAVCERCSIKELNYFFLVHWKKKTENVSAFQRAVVRFEPTDTFALFSLKVICFVPIFVSVLLLLHFC